MARRFCVEGQLQAFGGSSLTCWQRRMAWAHLTGKGAGPWPMDRLLGTRRPVVAPMPMSAIPFLCAFFVSHKPYLSFLDLESYIYMFQNRLSLEIFKSLLNHFWLLGSHIAAGWLTSPHFIIIFFKVSSEANLSRSNLGFGGKCHIRFISYLQMKWEVVPFISLLLKNVFVTPFSPFLRNTLGCHLKSYATLFSLPCFLEKSAKVISWAWTGRCNPL